MGADNCYANAKAMAHKVFTCILDLSNEEKDSILSQNVTGDET